MLRADLEGRPGLAGRAPADQAVLGTHEEAVVVRRLIVHGQRRWRREEGMGGMRVAMCMDVVVIECCAACKCKGTQRLMRVILVEQTTQLQSM